MSGKREISEAIEKMAGTFGKDFVAVFDAQVLSVNEEERTCHIKSISSDAEFEFENAALSAEGNDGVIIIPAVDSTVTVVIARQTIYITQYSDIDKFLVIIDKTIDLEISKDGHVFNKGKNGGVPNINPLKVEMAKLTGNDTILKTAIAAGFSALAALDSGASLAAFNSASAGMQVQDLSTLEDTKVKH
jgi:hypothetical protein